MTRLEEAIDTSEARCRRLGDLAAQATPPPSLDPRQWKQIEERMVRPSSARPRWLVLLAPVMAATGLILWLQVRRALDYSVQGCQIAADHSVSAPADRECGVLFGDGTRITLARNTQGRIDAHNYRRGATFALDHGHVDLAVVHRTSARWNVSSGPFDVRVTGTRFSVDWTPSSQHFTLRVSEGEVRVGGCNQHPEPSVRAGQGLEGDASRACTNLEPPPPPAVSTPSVPEAQAQAPEQHPRAEPTQAVVSRSGRRRHPGGGKLAIRSPEASGKVESPNPPATVPSPPDLTERDWSASSGLAPEVKLGPRRLTVGRDGRLTGPEPGTLNAVGGVATTFSFHNKTIEVPPAFSLGIADFPPNSSIPTRTLGNNLYLEDGALCTRGRIAALNCSDEKLPNARCDWKTNWGALIQWRPRDGQAWGDQAASSVAMEYRSRSWLRLVAHRQGDPDDLVYCVDGYRSGQRVTPSQFNLQCWKGGGTHLPDFRKVDYVALQVTSAEDSKRFRFCVSAIELR